MLAIRDRTLAYLCDFVLHGHQHVGMLPDIVRGDLATQYCLGECGDGGAGCRLRAARPQSLAIALGSVPCDVGKIRVEAAVGLVVDRYTPCQGLLPAALGMLRRALEIEDVGHADLRDTI